MLPQYAWHMQVLPGQPPGSGFVPPQERGYLPLGSEPVKPLPPQE